MLEISRCQYMPAKVDDGPTCCFPNSAWRDWSGLESDDVAPVSAQSVKLNTGAGDRHEHVCATTRNTGFY